MPLRVVGALIDIQAEKDVAEITRKIAAGDLTMDIVINHAETNSAKANVKNVAESLKQIVSEIRNFVAAANKGDFSIKIDLNGKAGYSK